VSALTPFERAALLAIALLTALAGVADYGAWAPVLSFALATLALAGLAWTVSFATGHLGDRFGPGVTGMLQSTLGNVPELFVVIFALQKGELIVAQTAIVGSVLANALLVLGLVIVVGARRSHDGVMRFSKRLPRDTATLLQVTVFIIVLLGLSLGSHDPASHHVQAISIVGAICLLAVYVAWVVPYLRSDTSPGEAEHDAPPRRTGTELDPEATESVAPADPSATRVPLRRRLPLALILALLIVGGAASAFVSDWFVAALQPSITQLHISQAFAGLVIVAIAGNAVENAAGLVLAWKGRSDLAISVVKNSVAQIAAFLFPALVLISLALSTTLTFSLAPVYIGALVLTVLALAQITGDGEAAEFEGWSLVALYVILATFTLYECPAPAPGRTGQREHRHATCVARRMRHAVRRGRFGRGRRASAAAQRGCGLDPAAAAGARELRGARRVVGQQSRHAHGAQVLALERGEDREQRAHRLPVVLVHQDDRARAQPADHVAFDLRVVGAERVGAVDVPEDLEHAVRVHDRVDSRIVSTVRRAEQKHAAAGRALERGLRVDDLPFGFARRDRRQQRVRERVVADRADGALGANDRRSSSTVHERDVATDDEERRVHAVLAQLREHELRVRAGPVVERQRDLVAARTGAVDRPPERDQAPDLAGFAVARGARRRGCGARASCAARLGRAGRRRGGARARRTRVRCAAGEQHDEHAGREHAEAREQRRPAAADLLAPGAAFPGCASGSAPARRARLCSWHRATVTLRRLRVSHAAQAR
jgi:Ca2+:H+ antiporter